MTLSTSGRIDSLPRSGIREIMELALSRPDAVRLDIGDPDFPTPAHIVEAAATAAGAGFTHYSPGAGLSSLREVVAAQVGERNGISCTPQHVVVTTGACGGLYSCFLALLDPGDEVLIPDPGWTTLVPMALAAGAKPAPYRLVRGGDGFALDVAAVEERLGPRTRAVIVNSPGNPTGAVASRRVLEDLLELAGRHGLWLISDECYEEIVFDGAHVSPLALGEPDRVVGVFSLSKSYAMTGWRVGYVTAPPAVARAITKAQEPVVSSASTISQKAAEAALLGPQTAVAAMRDEYRRRRDAALSLLDELGIAYARPSGAFYVMVYTSGAGETSQDVARRLLLEQEIAVVPGSAFGEGGEGMVRVSLAAPWKEIEVGLQRLASWLRA
jgi:aspartate/methionine/tyrosine aminotransferase